MKRLAQWSFLLVALATILEYLLIFGLFTGPIMLGVVTLVGAWNWVISFINKNYNEAALYLIATVALSMGYWKVMF